MLDVSREMSKEACYRKLAGRDLIHLLYEFKIENHALAGKRYVSTGSGSKRGILLLENNDSDVN